MRLLFVLVGVLLSYAAFAQESFTLSGTIGNYSGTAITLEAVAYSPDYEPITLDQTSVAPDGSFTLELPPLQNETLGTYIGLFPADQCKVSVSDETVTIAALSINYSSKDAAIGSLVLASSENVLELSSGDFSNATKQDKAATPLYATTASVIVGVCRFTETEPTQTLVLLRLEPGWNTVVLSFVKSRGATKLLMRTGSSDGLTWYMPSY